MIIRDRPAALAHLAGHPAINRSGCLRHRLPGTLVGLDWRLQSRLHHLGSLLEVLLQAEMPQAQDSAPPLQLLRRLPQAVSKAAQLAAGQRSKAPTALHVGSYTSLSGLYFQQVSSPPDQLWQGRPAQLFNYATYGQCRTCVALAALQTPDWALKAALWTACCHAGCLASCSCRAKPAASRSMASPL
jgi:hypothetical protein